MSRNRKRQGQSVSRDAGDPDGRDDLDSPDETRDANGSDADEKRTGEEQARMNRAVDPPA